MALKDIGKRAKKIGDNKAPDKGAEDSYKSSDGITYGGESRKDHIENHRGHDHQKGCHSPIEIFFVPFESFHMCTIHKIFFQIKSTMYPTSRQALVDK